MKSLYLLGIIFLLTSCTVKTTPIEYGTDSCDFCTMGIVDNKHASQIVTSKGKNYKFDAIECMISYVAENEKEQGSYSHILVADILNPGELVSAKDAAFIISKNIPSPMGAFLSATKSTNDADRLIEENTGNLYTYDQVVKQIKKH